MFTYDTVKKILMQKSNKKFDEILKNIKENAIKKIVENHIEKILKKQIQLLYYTLDELIDSGTVILKQNKYIQDKFKHENR